MVFSTRTATLFISLILHSVLAWLLGPAGRGSYTVCVVFLTVVGCLTALGLNGAGNYFIASKRMSLSCGVSTLMLVGILCSVLGVLTGLGLIHSGDIIFYPCLKYRFSYNPDMDSASNISIAASADT